LTPLALLPGPLRWRVDVQHTQHQQSSTSATSAQPAVSCVAFSPSGANVASACADGLLAIWSPPGLVGNAGRHASVVCGAAVACLAWDARADKLMLVGCSGGGGVRAWHADTRRIMADVASEPGWPHVVALAACPSEPAFAVAANSALLPAQLPAAGSSSASTAVALTGRLAVYNGRSFKRSAVLALPDDVGLASLAYSSSGSQLVVGTAAGSVLLFEPGSRSSPLRVWQVAAAVPPGPAAGGVLPVHVAWRAVPSAGAGAASGVVAVPGGVSSACGSFLSMCCGVLCEWGLAGVSSRTPLLAIDVIAAAAAAVEQQASPAGGSLDDAELMLGTDAQQQQQQQQQQHTNTRADSPGVDRQLWVCRYAASPDGSRVAVVAGQASVGVLLLYDLPGRTSSSSSSGGMLAQPQVLLQGDVLAGGGCVSWHPVQPVLVVGCASSSCSLTISLSADTTA
jgi:WD40 repeat protein